MKCISLWQPWATLLAFGEKKIETRSWPTNIRGTIAIHAAQIWTLQQKLLCHKGPFSKILLSRGYSIQNITNELEFGYIIGIAHLEKCEIITPNNVPVGQEFDFGDYTQGRYMWTFDDATVIKPIQYKGHQRFFDVPDNLFNSGE